MLTADLSKKEIFLVHEGTIFNLACGFKNMFKRVSCYSYSQYKRKNSQLLFILALAEPLTNCTLLQKLIDVKGPLLVPSLFL